MTSANKEIIPDDPRWSIGTASLENASTDNDYFLGDEARLFTQNSITMLTSEEGVGKTMLVLTCGLSLAQCGYRVLYIGAEGIGIAKKRVIGMLDGNMPPLTWAMCNNSFHAQETVKDLERVSEHFELIIVDTLRSVYEVNEKEASEARLVIAGWETARENDTAILTLHHIPKGGYANSGSRYLGSRAWGAGVDYGWIMTQDTGTKFLRLHQWKNRDGPDQPDKLGQIATLPTNAPIWNWLEVTYWNPTRFHMKHMIDVLESFPNGVETGDLVKHMVKRYPDEDWVADNVYHVVEMLTKERVIGIVPFEGRKRLILRPETQHKY